MTATQTRRPGDPRRPLTLPKSRPLPDPAHGFARMTIRINRQDYDARPVPVEDEGFGVVRAFRLRKPDGQVYDVAQTLDAFSCTCADHTYRREGLTDAPCKHASALVALGLLDGFNCRMPAEAIRS